MTSKGQDTVIVSSETGAGQRQITNRVFTLR